MSKRTLGDVAAESVREHDAAKVGFVADRLRACGLNYDQSFDVVQHACQKRGVQVSKAGWETLLYESEEHE